MNRNEDAVSPVIGVILMVAITVILAAVIAAFVFGMGPAEMAPQSSLRASADTDNSSRIVMIEHQGGDEVILDATNTKVTLDGATLSLDLTSEASLRFEAGETIYLYSDADTATLGNATTMAAASVTSANHIAAAGETVSVKLIDVASQQMVADMDVRF